MHLSKFILLRLIALSVFALATLPLFGKSGLPEIQTRINAAFGRDVYVDVATIDGKIHSWSDIKRWVPLRKNSSPNMPYPESLKGSGISEVITVRLIISPKGEVINPIVEDLKNKELALPAILHAAGLRFEIPRIDGEPVYLNQKVKLICSEDPAFGKKN